jgi:4-aminobutyrate aminotransferase-like enzyme
MDDSGGGSPAPPFPRPLPWLKVLARTALERGVNVAVRGNLLILCPPLVIDQTDLEAGLSVIESLL